MAKTKVVKMLSMPDHAKMVESWFLALAKPVTVIITLGQLRERQLMLWNL